LVKATAITGRRIKPKPWVSTMRLSLTILTGVSALEEGREGGEEAESILRRRDVRDRGEDGGPACRLPAVMHSCVYCDVVDASERVD